MYKLKNENGRVNSLLRSGKDFVKNNLAVSAAQHIIDTGEVVESDKEDYPICVDNKWYFEGEKMNTAPIAPATNNISRKGKGKR